MLCKLCKRILLSYKALDCLQSMFMFASQDIQNALLTWVVFTSKAARQRHTAQMPL